LFLYAAMSAWCSTFSRSFGVVLVLAMLFGIALPTAVLVNFTLNRAEITLTKCVERFKPIEKNSCKGSCHLKKEMKKAAGEEGDAPAAPRLETVEIIALPPTERTEAFAQATVASYPLLRESVLLGHRASVDHVPWLA